MEKINKQCCREFSSLAVDDVFKIRQHLGRDISHILDVGANIGLFSNLATNLFPRARVTAVEPCGEIFNVMQRNVESMVNVTTVHAGFGPDGYVKPVLDKKFPVGTIAAPCGEKEENAVLSMSLPTIFNTFDNVENYMLKFDCEGAEASMIGDKPSEEILKGALHIGMEIHFMCPDPKSVNWPAWSVYNDWVHDMFMDTHDILYHCSSTKRGYGHYVLRKKDLPDIKLSSMPIKSIKPQRHL